MNIKRSKPEVLPQVPEGKDIKKTLKQLDSDGKVQKIKKFTSSPVGLVFFMSSHRRTTKSEVLPPLCLTVTLYLRLHSSLSLLFNACLILSIFLFIIVSAQALQAIGGKAAAYSHASHILRLPLRLPLLYLELLTHRWKKETC